VVARVRHTHTTMSCPCRPVRWRDPFIVERPNASNNHEWVMLMGSGIKGVGGTTLVYRTPSLRDPAAWRYDGMLCLGDGTTGAVWECPLVARLRPLPPAQHRLPSHTLGLGSRAASSSMPRLPPVSEEEAANGRGGGGAGPGGGPKTGLGPEGEWREGMPQSMSSFDER